MFRWNACAVSVFPLFAASSLLAAPMGTSFTYQGQLKYVGVPISGIADFEFHVWTAATGGVLRDSVGPTTLGLINGLLSTQIDFGAGTFDGSALWLEIRVRYPSGLGAWTTLSPRQAITPAPYALLAKNAEVLELPFAGSVSSSATAIGVTQGGNGRAGSFSTTSASNNSPTLYAEQAGTGRCGHFRITNSGNALEAVAASTTGTGAALSGYTTGNGPAVYGRTEGVGNAGQFVSTSGDNTNPTLYAEQAGTGRCGHFRITNSSNPLEAVAASTTGTGAAISGYTTGSGPAVYARTDGGGAAGEFVSTTGDNAAYLGGEDYGIASHGDAVIRNGAVRLFNGGGTETVEIVAGESTTDQAGQITLRKADGTQTIEADANYASGGGRVSISGGNTSHALYAEGRGAGRSEATLRVHNSEPNQGMAGYITSSSTFATVHIQNDGPGETLWLENGGGGPLIVARDAALGRWQFWVDGDGITNTRVVRIHGGADLSEGFDVQGLPADGQASELAEGKPAPTGTTPEPGMVVSIDSRNPGKLVVSRTPFDRTVAGIISGAGGVNPGMLMGQGDSTADGEYPVALTGRVYGLCTASNGPIRPGDLLTTSGTPGHAMKVTEHEKAQGAIIGKAMTGLPEGQGLVLILVSLQ